MWLVMRFVASVCVRVLVVIFEPRSRNFIMLRYIFRIPRLSLYNLSSLQCQGHGRTNKNVSVCPVREPIYFSMGGSINFIAPSEYLGQCQI